MRILYWCNHDFPRISVRGRIAVERHNARVLARRLAAARPHVVAWWALEGMSLSLVERVRHAGIPADAGALAGDPALRARACEWAGWRHPPG